MDKLNSRHLIFIILGTCIVSYKTYPNIIVQCGRRDSWIAVSIASIFLILYAIYTLRIFIKTKCYDLYNIYTSALGKNLGSIFYILFIFTLFLTLVESASVEANSMHQNMILETPTWFILLLFIITTAYCVKKGLRPLIITTIAGMFFVMLAGTNLGILTQKYKDNKYLYPILQWGFDKNMIIATLRSLALYGPISILFPYLNNIVDKHRIIKTSLVGILIVVQMQIYSLIGVVTTFGYKKALTIYYPKLIQTQLVSHFDFLEAGELFVMLQIVGGWFIKYILTFYAFLKLIEIFYNKKKSTAILVISILVFILSHFTSKNGFLMLKLLVIYNYIVLINFIIIPAIIFTIYSARVSNHKSNKDESGDKSSKKEENSEDAKVLKSKTNLNSEKSLTVYNDKYLLPQTIEKQKNKMLN